MTDGDIVGSQYTTMSLWFNHISLSVCLSVLGSLSLSLCLTGHTQWTVHGQLADETTPFQYAQTTYVNVVLFPDVYFVFL